MHSTISYNISGLRWIEFLPWKAETQFNLRLLANIEGLENIEAICCCTQHHAWYLRMPMHLYIFTYSSTYAKSVRRTPRPETHGGSRSLEAFVAPQFNVSYYSLVSGHIGQVRKVLVYIWRVVAQVYIRSTSVLNVSWSFEQAKKPSSQGIQDTRISSLDGYSR